MTCVLVLSWEYPPLVEGGLARHVGRLSEELAAQGHEVHVVTRGGHGLPGAAVPAGVHVHRVASPPTPWDLDAFLAWTEQLNARLLAAALDVAASTRVELVHGHDWLVGEAGAALASRLGVPLVVTLHATEHGRHEGRVHQHPQDRIHASERRIARRADAVIACSAFLREHVVDVFGLEPARVRAIPNGVDVPDAAEGPREPLVLLVGRLVYEKGFQVALDALPAVLDAVPGARWAVAGAGPYEAQLRARAAELRVLDRGEFLGWAGDPELAGLYARAQVCAIPSLYEPFGLVALEAMARGCAVVAADTGGLREVVPGGTGLRAAAGDPGALARALTRMLTDAGLRARLTAAGRSHAAALDWAGAARRTVAVYGEVLAAPAAP